MTSNDNEFAELEAVNYNQGESDETAFKREVAIKYPPIFVLERAY